MRRFLILLTCIMWWWQQDILVERSTAYPIINDALVQIHGYFVPSPLKPTLRNRDTFLEHLWDNHWPNTDSPVAKDAESTTANMQCQSNDGSSTSTSRVHSPSAPSSSVRGASSPMDVSDTELKLSSDIPSSPASSTMLPIDEKEQTLLIAGDSMASGVAITFRQIIQQSKKPYHFLDYTKHSTGLTNRAYYDWPVELHELIESKKPDRVVFFVGANDAQGLKIDKSWYRVDEAAWAEEYAARIVEVCKASKDTELYWIGLPPMENSEYNTKIQRINDILSKTVSQCGTFAHWIDISDLFGGERYQASSMIENKSVKLRAGDGIHMTYQGYALISKRLWNLWYTKDIHD